MDKNIRGNFLLSLLGIFVFIGLLGAAKPVLFNGGSSLAKYFAKQKQLEMVQEKNVEEYMESALFGDGSESLDVEGPVYSEEERTEAVSIIFHIDSFIAAALFILSLLLFLPKVLEKYRLYHLLIPISLWLLCLSLGSMLNGGKKYSELAILAHATRWGLPLVLWLAFYCRAKGIDFLKNKVLYFTAILCCSLTFAVHGWEAYNLNPPFQDLIYRFASMVGISVPESVNFGILKAVGCMDLLLAASILFLHKPKIFLWMAFWGLITAFSRPLTMGFDAWPEFAMRIANCALPFGLFLIFKTQKQAVVEPELNTQKMEMIYE